MALVASRSPNKSTTVRANRDRAVRAVRFGLRALQAVSPDAAASVAGRLMVSPYRYPRPAWEARALRDAWPGTIRSAGRRIATWEWHGQAIPPLGRMGDPLPTILLVHGWEGRGSQLSGLVPALVARGWRVVAFDAPGHGDSGGSTASVLDFVTTIRHVAEAVGPVRGVVAHSFGAIATAVALARGLTVDRVAFVAPGAWTEATLDELQGTFGVSDDVMRRMQADLARRTGERPTDLHAARVYAGRREPMLLVHDVDDTAIPRERVAHVAATWPPVELVETSGLGHRRILRDPAVAERVAEHFGPAR